MGPANDVDDGVIGVADDGAVMGEEGVAEVGQLFEGLGFAKGDGFIGAVPGGGDDGEPEAVEKERVEGRVGEEDTEVGRAGGNGRGDLGEARAGTREKKNRGLG